MKRQNTEEREIFASYSYHRELIYRIYKEFQTKTQVNKQPNLNLNSGTIDPSRVLSKTRNIANGRLKKSSISLAFRKMKVEDTLNFHLISMRIIVNKISDDNRYLQGFVE